jgi:hypothetical protein
MMASNKAVEMNRDGKEDSLLRNAFGSDDEDDQEEEEEALEDDNHTDTKRRRAATSVASFLA